MATDDSRSRKRQRSPRKPAAQPPAPAHRGADELDGHSTLIGVSVADLVARQSEPAEPPIDERDTLVGAPVDADLSDLATQQSRPVEPPIDEQSTLVGVSVADLVAQGADPFALAARQSEPVEPPIDDQATSIRPASQLVEVENRAAPVRRSSRSQIPAAAPFGEVTEQNPPSRRPSRSQIPAVPFGEATEQNPPSRRPSRSHIPAVPFGEATKQTAPSRRPSRSQIRASRPSTRGELATFEPEVVATYSPERTRAVVALAGVFILLLAAVVAWPLLRGPRPSQEELAVLYPYGIFGSTLADGSRAPPVGAISFEYLRTVPCGGEGSPDCLVYELRGGLFVEEMWVAHHQGAWIRVSNHARASTGGSAPPTAAR